MAGRKNIWKSIHRKVNCGSLDKADGFSQGTPATTYTQSTLIIVSSSKITFHLGTARKKKSNCSPDHSCQGESVIKVILNNVSYSMKSTLHFKDSSGILVGFLWKVQGLIRRIRLRITKLSIMPFFFTYFLIISKPKLTHLAFFKIYLQAFLQRKNICVCVCVWIVNNDLVFRDQYVRIVLFLNISLSLVSGYSTYYQNSTNGEAFSLCFHERISPIFVQPDILYFSSMLTDFICPRFFLVQELVTCQGQVLPNCTITKEIIKKFTGR